MKITYLDGYHYFNSTIMSEAPVFLHVGVYSTQTFIAFKGMYPKAKMHAVEAEPNNYNKMLPAMQKLGVYFSNRALSEKNEDVSIHRYTNNVSHSVFARHEHDPNCVLVESSIVRGNTLEFILGNHEIEHVDLMILNCEGAELFALREMLKQPALMAKFNQICVSFHCPRIYPTAQREGLLAMLSKDFHIVKETHPTGVPDILLIRRDQ